MKTLRLHFRMKNTATAFFGIFPVAAILAMSLCSCNTERYRISDEDYRQYQESMHKAFHHTPAPASSGNKVGAGPWCRLDDYGNKDCTYGSSQECTAGGNSCTTY